MHDAFAEHVEKSAGLTHLHGCVLRRPATICSYAIAGLSALLSSFCYAEYAVDYPIAGGAFTYM